MEYVVPDHIAYCLSAGRPIFLDVVRDRYFTIPARLAEAFVAFVNGERPMEPSSALETLTRHGLLARSSAPPAPRPIIEPARRSLAGEGSSSPSLGDGLAVAGHVWRTYRRLKRGPLTDVLVDLKRRRGVGSSAKAEQTTNLCARFARQRSFVPIKPNCLLDSIALLEFMRAHGGDADLVFGVTPSPFSAHCWLQRHDQVINDALDRVLPRLPIMVV